MFSDRKEIPVFQKEDIEKLLKKFNLYELFINGELICPFCNETITIDNFGCFYLTTNKEVSVCCSRPECLEKVAREISDESN